MDGHQAVRRIEAILYGVGEGVAIEGLGIRVHIRVWIGPAIRVAKGLEVIIPKDKRGCFQN